MRWPHRCSWNRSGCSLPGAVPGRARMKVPSLSANCRELTMLDTLQRRHGRSPGDDGKLINNLRMSGAPSKKRNFTRTCQDNLQMKSDPMSAPDAGRGTRSSAYCPALSTGDPFVPAAHFRGGGHADSVPESGDDLITLRVTRFEVRLPIRAATVRDCS